MIARLHPIIHLAFFIASLSMRIPFNTEFGFISEDRYTQADD